MNIRNMTLEEMQNTTEKQEFDRKSARIDATSIAIPIIAFHLFRLKLKEWSA